MDFVAIPFIIVALWALGERHRWGFICQIIGSLLFVIAAAETAMWGFVVANAIFALLAIKGWYSWKPKAEEPAAHMTDNKFTLNSSGCTTTRYTPEAFTERCDRINCPHCKPQKTWPQPSDIDPYDLQYNTQ